MPIKTSIPNYSLLPKRGVVRPPEGPYAGYSCVYDNKGGALCVDDTGTQATRIYEDETTNDLVDTKGIILPQRDVFGNRKVRFYVNEGSEEVGVVEIDLFTLLYITKLSNPNRVAVYEGNGLTPVLNIDRAVSESDNGLRYNFNVHRDNLVAIPKTYSKSNAGKLYLEKYKKKLESKKEDINERITNNRLKRYEVTGSTVWLSNNIEDFFLIKIENVTVRHSTIDLNDIDVKGLPDMGKYFIVPRKYESTTNINEIGKYFKSFVPEMTSDYFTRLSKKSLSSVKIKIKLKGFYLSYDAETLKPKKKLIEDDSKGTNVNRPIVNSITIPLGSFKKTIINGKSVNDENVPEPEIIYLKQDVDDEEIINHRTARDVKFDKIHNLAKEKAIKKVTSKYNELSNESEKDAFIMDLYLKRFGDGYKSKMKSIVEDVIGVLDRKNTKPDYNEKREIKGGNRGNLFSYGGDRFQPLPPGAETIPVELPESFDMKNSIINQTKRYVPEEVGAYPPKEKETKPPILEGEDDDELFEIKL